MYSDTNDMLLHITVTGCDTMSPYNQLQSVQLSCNNCDNEANSKCDSWTNYIVCNFIVVATQASMHATSGPVKCDTESCGIVVKAA